MCKQRQAGLPTCPTGLSLLSKSRGATKSFHRVTCHREQVAMTSQGHVTSLDQLLTSVTQTDDAFSRERDLRCNHIKVLDFLLNNLTADVPG